MLPGKIYAPEDLVRILQRRFWLLLVPFAIIAATTAVVARKLPDLYKSDALILVIPQRVPEAYVKSQVTTTRIEDRLQAIANQILSRTRLERIIQDFNLYADERQKTGIMEDVVDEMRANIVVKVERGDAFRVTYVGSNPTTVMKVTDRLANLFIEESLRDREVLAEGTSQFLDTQLQDSKRRLLESEKKLEEYKRRFTGQLPTQVESNLAAIQVNTQHIQSILEAQRRLRDERMTLERRLEDHQASTETGPGQIGSTDLVSPTTRQLEMARAELAGLQQRYRAVHPDVAKAQRRVSELEAQAEAEALNMPVAVAAQAANPGQAARLRQINELQEKMNAIDKAIADNAAQEKALRATVNTYQARVDSVPTRESEMIELTRDYTTLQSQYGSLLAKREDSNIAANLERRQIGEQFKLLDSARRPERPFSPNRQAINLGGVFGGLAVGIALIALLEYRDASFKTDDDITRVLALPVLAVVPVMQNAGEKRMAFRRGLLFSLGMSAIVTICLGVVVFYTFLRQ